MNDLKRYWLPALWILGLLSAGYLYYYWYVEPDLVGIVESKAHPLGAREDGRMDLLKVAVGDRVEKGQLLARLDISDLVAEKNAIEAELTELDERLEADRQRYRLELEQLKLQLESRDSTLMQRGAELQAKRTELSGLNAEIDRLEQAEKAGLGHSRDMSDLIVRRDALARYISALSSLLRTDRRKSRSAPKIEEETDVDMLSSMLSERQERINELRHMLVILENRIDYRTILSPADGLVSEVLAMPGDTVIAFNPLVSVEEETPVYIEVYLPEMVDIDIEVGDRAMVFSKKTGGHSAFATVSFIYPGFSRIPERLMFRREVSWARKFRVRLDDGHPFLPGESVRVQLLGNGEASAGENNAHASDEGAGKVKRPAPATEMVQAEEKAPKPGPMSISIPPEISRISRFEASGICRLAEIDRFLIVSDDTGLPEKDNHIPWLFLMDSKGQMEPAPIRLEGVEKINDLEAIAPADKDMIYLVSSQNISKRGQRPRSREMIYEVKRTGRSLKVERSLPLLSLLLDSYDKRTLKNLGLKKKEKDGKVRINIEAAAWREGKLYLGLKQPVGEKGAILWELSEVDRAFDEQKLHPGQVRLLGRVHLGGEGKRAAGFSDLVFDEKGRLLALSTIPRASDGEQESGLHLIEGWESGELSQKNLKRFPKLKAEGICPTGDSRLMLVFDRDSENPLFQTIDVDLP